jgi:hypothetical protein
MFSYKEISSEQIVSSYHVTYKNDGLIENTMYDQECMMYKCKVSGVEEKHDVQIGPVLDPDLDMNGEENNSVNGSLQELLVQEEFSSNKINEVRTRMATHF